MTPTDNPILAWLTLHLTPGLGAVGCCRLADHCGGAAQVFTRTLNDLRAVPGIKQSALQAVVQQTAVAQARQELPRATQCGIELIPWDDDRYPARLRDIHAPPALLYVKGRTESLQAPCLAIVGSRAATGYGRRVAAELAHKLAVQGFTIVSGLALGIDAEAHQGALAAGGNTIGVLGCGPDLIYPQGNHRLFATIPGHGAIVSEYPLGTKPDAFRFPARNRIISGLSLGVVVVEATQRSGSLITASHALEQGREVFAIPGQLDSIKSAGAHGLLQQGAKLVMSIQDILDELPPLDAVARCESTPHPKKPSAPLTPAEQQLHAFVEVYPKSIDDIVQESGLAAGRVSELLLLLELKGVVEALPGKNFQRCSNTAL